MLFASLHHSVAASTVVDSQRYRYATQPAKNSNIDFESPGFSAYVHCTYYYYYILPLLYMHNYLLLK